MELVLVAIIAALGAAYFVGKARNAASSGVVPTGVTVGTTSTNQQQITNNQAQYSAQQRLPQFKANPVLMSDQQIAQTSVSIGMSSSDRTRFIQKCISVDLPQEQIIEDSLTQQCGSGGHYLGGSAALTSLKGGQIGLSFAGSAFGVATGAAIPVLGAAISIFSAISAHHAAAVRNEQGLECALVPPANQALQVIETAVMNGTITPLQGRQALDRLAADFYVAAKNGQSGQLSEGSGHCNAMCWYYHYLKAIIMKKQDRYSQYVS